MLERAQSSVQQQACLASPIVQLQRSARSASVQLQRCARPAIVYSWRNVPGQPQCTFAEMCPASRQPQCTVAETCPASPSAKLERCARSALVYSWQNMPGRPQCTVGETCQASPSVQLQSTESFSLNSVQSSLKSNHPLLLPTTCHVVLFVPLSEVSPLIGLIKQSSCTIVS